MKTPQSLARHHSLLHPCLQHFSWDAEWYRLAATQGNAAGQYNLAHLYYAGRGVGQSFREAAEWFRRSAVQGDAQAQHNLGVMYEHGQGVPPNYAEALKWYRLATKNGLPQAQHNLGAMYANGRGVAQSNVKALAWLEIASRGEYSMAKSARDNVEARMTADQIAEAQKLARECVARKYKDCD